MQWIGKNLLHKVNGNLREVPIQIKLENRIFPCFEHKYDILEEHRTYPIQCTTEVCHTITTSNKWQL